jgi:hypothetical protein
MAPATGLQKASESTASTAPDMVGADEVPIHTQTPLWIVVNSGGAHSSDSIWRTARNTMGVQVLDDDPLPEQNNIHALGAAVFKVRES